MATEHINIWMRMKGAAKANQSVQSLNSSLTSTIAKYGGLAVAGTAALSFFKSSISAQIEQDKIFRRLETSIKLTGQSYKSVEKDLLGYFDALQKTTEFGDTESAQALQTLTVLTGDYNKALKNLPLTLDIASSGMFDLNTAARMVGQAASGAPEIWGRYIAELKSNANPELKNLKTTAEKAEYAMNILNEKFGGTAQENVDSYAGKIKQLSNRYGDIQEKFGDVILQLGEQSGAFEGLQGWLDNIQESWWNLYAPINAYKRLMEETTEDTGLDEMKAGWEAWVQIGNDVGKTTEKTKTKFQEFREELVKNIETQKEQAYWTYLVNAEMGLIEPTLGKSLEGFKRMRAEIKDTNVGMVGMIKTTEHATEAVSTNALNALMVYEDGINEIASRAAGFFGEHTAAAKAALVTQATMDTYAGANRALGAFPPPFSYIAAAAVVAMGLANVAKITGFQTGGSFVVPGSGGTDNQTVAFKASPGEQVTVETPEQMTKKGVTIIFNNPIMDQRFTEQKIIPMIKKAMRKM